MTAVIIETNDEEDLYPRNGGFIWTYLRNLVRR